MTIIVNLTFIKEIQLIMPKYLKTFQFVLDVFLTDVSEGNTRSIVQFLCNLSLNSDLHVWIAEEETLVRLRDLFFNPMTSESVCL
jgi:hypothetical protein